MHQQKKILRMTQQNADLADEAKVIARPRGLAAISQHAQ